MKQRQQFLRAVLLGAILLFAADAVQAFYNPVVGRWLNRDPIGEEGGLNVHGFIGNQVIGKIDQFGLKDYKLGSEDPSIHADRGAGRWDSEEWTMRNVYLKWSFIEALYLSGVSVGMPDAVAHIRHYFGNSGADYFIRLQKMLDDVPSAERVHDREIALAQAFVETLPDGRHAITSGRPSGEAEGAYNRKDESRNWYYAVGGYSAWGKGNVTVCEDEYTMEFEYKFYDRYNWDTGKSVTILGQTVTDEFMGEFHRQGIAREFDMYGSVKRTVKWKRGQSPVVTDGWDSEKGGR